MRGRKSRVFIAGAILVCVAPLFVTRELWLGAIGRSLVRSESPQPADAILVLAGDWRGARIMRACELLHEGYAPVVLVSGPTEWYGLNEADAALRFAASRGCSGEGLQPVRMHALSTVEEAEVFAPELRRRGIRNLLIVTSNYHTRRAGRIFERVLGGAVRVRMIPAPDQYFEPTGWWKSREGQKTVFYEVSKTAADWIGL